MIPDKQVESRRVEDPPAARRADRRGKALSLSHCLSEDPASFEAVIPQLVQVIQAVEEAHDQKKEHRYLSPDKIHFTGDGSVQVPASSARGTAETVALGSLKYVAPESLEQREGLDNCRLRDCYVLGFMFYEILLGRKLFESQFRDISTQGEFGWLTWHADKTKAALPLTKVINHFPQSVSALITEMTAKDHAARTKDLKVVAHTLASTLEVTRVYSGALANADPRSAPPDPQYASRAKTFWSGGWLGQAGKFTWIGEAAKSAGSSIATLRQRALRGGASVILRPVTRLATALSAYAEPRDDEAKRNGGGS